MSRASRLACLVAVVVIVSPGMSHAGQVIDGPTLTMDPRGFTPLAGVVRMETDQPVGVVLRILSIDEAERVVEFPEPRTLHELPVLGLRPDTTYTVEVELNPGGPVGTLEAVTGPLPEDFPLVEVLVSIPERMEPGYTLLDCFIRSPGDERPRYMMILDAAGNVVWYSTICRNNLKMLPNGNLSYLAGVRATETDLLGDEQFLATLTADHPLTLHHDFQRTVAGTYISLSRTTVPDVLFPTSSTDPGAPLAPAEILDEPVVEFFPDGTLRREWPLVDMIDPMRIGFDSRHLTENGYDWVHNNAIHHAPSDDTLIVSVRHQDAVVKFSRNTGEIKWILGNHANWPPELEPYLLEPVGDPFEWQYHQHAPMVTTDGTLLLFDNGNHRASPFDGTIPLSSEESYSRAVEYDIDEETMQVRQRWEWKDVETPLYAHFIGDADWQPLTHNVVITFGGTSWIGGESLEALGIGVHARIIEVEHTLEAEKVFDVAVRDPDGGRMAIYRSERIPSLYPVAVPAPPNGVGETLRIDRTAGVRLRWAASPVDATHAAADYYAIYASDAPGSGFSIVETATTTGELLPFRGSIEYYKIVAVNATATSGDEPAP